MNIFNDTDLDSITEGTGLNVNKASEIVQVDGGDTNSFDNKLDEILKPLLQEFKFRTPEGAVPNGYQEAKQAIKQLVADEMMGLLDRVESNKESLLWWTGGEYDKTTGVDMRAIAAERTKLAEWLGEIV